MHLRLLLEYDGTDFRGWQIQPDERTVQGELETRLETLFGQPIRVTAAGRTDTGVHALGQVVSFTSPRPTATDDLKHSLNGMLPADVVVKDVQEVDEDFNARFSATAREYYYDICYGHRAIGRHYAWRRHEKLDLDALRASARAIVGSHDFTSFCVAAQERDSRVCDVTQCDWEASRNGLRMTIRANRFVRAMVRSLVGTFVDVGRGFTSSERIPEILEAQDRSAAGPTAPAHGLFLARVDYD